jgi:hypothetical protein
MIALALALLMAAEPATTPTPVPTRRPGPTFCAEWVRQTKEGYERLTLFTDHTLVWKTSAGGQDDVRRKTIAPAETEFYCTYFSREEFWSLPGDLRSGLTGEHLRESRVTLTRSDGSRKAIRFDELSSFSPEGSSLRSALLGLRNLFTARLSPAAKFTAETLPPGTVLRRFDGAFFRVRRVIADKEVVELEGVEDPISYFVKLSEMRYQFPAPE